MRFLAFVLTLSLLFTPSAQAWDQHRSGNDRPSYHTHVQIGPQGPYTYKCYEYRCQRRPGFIESLIGVRPTTEIDVQFANTERNTESQEYREPQVREVIREVAPAREQEAPEQQTFVPITNITPFQARIREGQKVIMHIGPNDSGRIPVGEYEADILVAIVSGTRWEPAKIRPNKERTGLKIRPNIPSEGETE